MYICFNVPFLFISHICIIMFRIFVVFVVLLVLVVVSLSCMVLFGICLFAFVCFVCC